MTSISKISHFLEIVNPEFPAIGKRLQKAFESKESSTFVAEHFDKICDWMVIPITQKQEVHGYIVEVSYPSLWEMKAIEQSVRRLENRRVLFEKELVKFTQALTKFKLYEKGAEIGLGQFNPEDYQHPLLRNSIKIVQHLAGCLQKLYGEINHLNTELQTASEVEASKPTPVPVAAAPLAQVSALSSSIVRNVHEAKYDFAALNKELMKLKSLIKEQKMLNHAYSKPVGKAMQTVEQGLIQTVEYSEAMTLILQQLHENQTQLTYLQDFMDKLEGHSGNSSLEKTEQFYQVNSLFMDIKQSVMASKVGLRDLVVNFDGIKGHWNQTLENLQSCLELSANVDQAADRWGTISDAANEHSQSLHTRIQYLIDLTQKIQSKTQGVDTYDGPVPGSFPVRSFDHIAIDVDESKRKAEDVLLEGIGKLN